MSVATQSPLALDLHLPWEKDPEQEEKFKRLLKRLLILLLVLFIVIPLLPVVEKEYEERELDIVKTEIVLEPLIVEPVATPEPVAPKPKPKPKPKPLQKKIDKPKDAKAIAKEQKKKDVAEEQGLTAISDSLSSLRQSLDLQKLQQKNVSTSQGGQIARADTSVLGEDNLTQKSEGIVVDDSMMKNNTVALAKHQSTKLDGVIDDSAPFSDSENYYTDLQGRRSTESIRRVIENGKGRAYHLYQRELRDKPDLLGVVSFKIVIEPSGEVSNIALISSELNSPELNRRILEILKQLNFGAEDVQQATVNWKLNFLPPT